MTLLERRRAMMAQVESGGGRLPSAYQEIQYIEGTSADQYIDSGWLYTDDFEIAAKIYFTATEQTFYRDEVGNFSFRFIFASNIKARFDLGATNRYIYYNNPADLPAVRDYRTYTIPFKAGEQVEIDVDGYRVSGSCANSAAKTITHKFAKGRQKLYGYQIISESVLVRDFVPCYRKSDSEPGMYDLISRRFFANAGTGEFLVGPDIN